MRGALTAPSPSNSSLPVIADRASATSSTPAANRPTVSSVHEKHLTPTVGNIRYDGLIAATPQKEAGRITEPAVCVPSASGTMPAATAAAEPDDDPPGVCSLFQGLTVAPGCRQANSVETVLPKIVAPSCRRRSTTQASAAGT